MLQLLKPDRFIEQIAAFRGLQSPFRPIQCEVELHA